MKKASVLAFSFLLLSGAVRAEQISESQAASIAAKYLPVAQRQALRSAQSPESRGGVASYYVFNAEDNNGFVIVSGDDSMTELVGYSRTGHFDESKLPENMRVWLREYSNYVEAVQAGEAKGFREMLEAATPVVEPLITSKWDQTEPYGDLLPTFVYDGQLYRYVTGCAATAMAQVMNYYEHPKQGMGSHAYSFTNNIGDKLAFDVDFTQSKYDWANMLDVYKKGEYTKVQSTAVAKLMYDCGVSIDMMYHPGMSASMDTDIPYAMANYFGYDASFHLRMAFTSKEFFDLLYSELDAKRPVMFGGAGPTNIGHEFVVDGYDSNGFVHVNWGWSGQSDGYFNANYMNPVDLGTGAGIGSYMYQQTIITAKPVESGKGTYGQTYLGYYGGQIIKSNVTPSTLEKGRKFNLYAAGVYNATNRKYEGNIALAIYNTEGERVVVCEAGKRMVSIEAGNYVGGQWSKQAMAISDELVPLADGDYTIYTVSCQDGYDEWVPVSGRHSFKINISGDIVTLIPEQEYSLKVIAPIAASTTEFHQGSTVGFMVKLHNPSDIVADGKLGIEILDKEDKVIGSAQAPVIVYDGEDYEAIYTLKLDRYAFAVGETYRFQVKKFENSEVNINTPFTLDMAAVEPFEFTILEEAGVENVTDGRVNVYPNPATDYVTVECEPPIKSVALFGADGRQMVNAPVDGTSTVYKVDLNGMPSGYYVIVAETENGTGRTPLLKR